MGSFLDEFNKNEQIIYRYIQEITQNGKIELNEPYSTIAANNDISTTTVHRCINKFNDLGIVSVVLSPNVARSNTIIFHKQKSSEEQEREIREIAESLSNMSLATERITKIIDLKDLEIAKLKEMNDSLNKEISLLKELSKLDEKNIISKQDIDEKTVAYLFKK